MPPEAINSKLPAYKYQEPHHKFLHLVSVSSLVRKSVFRSAFNEVCKAYNNSKTTNVFRLPDQLGITRNVLIKHCDILSKESEDLARKIESDNYNNISLSLDDILKVYSIYYLLICNLDKRPSERYYAARIIIR